MATQNERREATRAALVAAAREAFVDNGYDEASTDAILVRAGLSKGALYHHFSNKADLLGAVFESVLGETAAAAHSATARARDSRSAVAVSLKAWLRAVLHPVPRRIILETGPAVLGFARARSLEEPINLAPLRRMIEQAVAKGEAVCEDADLAARLLSAAVAELALVAMERDQGDAGMASFDQRIDALIDALL